MVLSLAAVLLLSGADAGPTVAQIDALARRKDVAGLSKYLAVMPMGMVNPFRILRTGGAYDVGKYGWHAEELVSADGTARYVVVATPLTGEDTGELVFRRVGRRLRFVPEGDAMGTQVLRHRFDLRFDIGAKKAYLVDDLTLRIGAGAPRSIFLRMSPQYRVSSIRMDGRPVRFTEAAGVISMEHHGSGTYRLEYGAVVNLPNYAGSISNDEATLVNDYWYPMVARQPSRYEITIHSPKGWTAVAQGEKLFEKETAIERVTRYRMDRPVTFFSVVAAPFAVASQQLGKYRYSAWSTRVSPERLRLQTELYRPVFEFYASHFGPPPYPMYGAVDSKHYGGGAMEAYTFATYGGGVPSEDAHEPSHTWWGGLINNTYLHSFWNESFADFSDGMYRRNVGIGNHEERRLAFVSDASAEKSYETAAMEQSGADIGPAGSDLGYGKGAKVLQMLEQWLGTDAVVSCMREWIAVHPLGKPGEWADFKRIVERRYPQTKGFFSDWVRRPGYARFAPTIRWSGGRVLVDMHWTGLAFRMPLTVMLQTGSRRDFRTVYVDGSGFAIPAPQKPELVSIDPYRQALRMYVRSESPVSLDLALAKAEKVIEPLHADWLPGVGGKPGSFDPNLDPAGKFLVGSPESWPLMRTLCTTAGFVVSGNKLSYLGTTIDLNHGCALAVVDLGGGKSCVIGLGKTQVGPNWGRARLVLTDDLGRFLRGATEPKTQGALTYRL